MPIAQHMSTLLQDLQAESSVITAELRPPRAELATAASMDAWIDTYHAVKSLTRGSTHRIGSGPQRREFDLADEVTAALWVQSAEVHEGCVLPAR